MAIISSLSGTRRREFLHGGMTAGTVTCVGRRGDDGRSVPAIHFLGLGSKLGRAGRLSAHPTLTLASAATNPAARF